MYFVWIIVLSLLVLMLGGTISSAGWNQFEYFGFFSALIRYKFLGFDLHSCGSDELEL